MGVPCLTLWPLYHCINRPWYTSNVRLGGLRFQAGGFGEEKIMLFVLGIELQFLGRPGNLSDEVQCHKF
jgi:hypothetical protein